MERVGDGKAGVAWPGMERLGGVRQIKAMQAETHMNTKTYKARIGRIPIKPCYRVSELALMAGLSKEALTRMLRRHGVPIQIDGNGSPGLVYLVALREGLPDWWESMLLARSMSI